MALTREVLEARLEQLRTGLRTAQAEQEQSARVVVATDGAIQECEWALAQLDPDPLPEASDA